jgi:hypothetical protein
MRLVLTCALRRNMTHMYLSMWWQIYFAAVLTKYVVVMYLCRNYIRNEEESGVESGVECSETNVRKLRFGINFQEWNV